MDDFKVNNMEVSIDEECRPASSRPAHRRPVTCA